MDAADFKDFDHRMQWNQHLLLTKPDHPNAPKPYDASEGEIIYVPGGMERFHKFVPDTDAGKAASYFYEIAKPFDPDGFPDTVVPISQKFVECMERLLREPVIDILVPTTFFLYRWNYHPAHEMKRDDLIYDSLDRNNLPARKLDVHIIGPNYLAGDAINTLGLLANNRRLEYGAGTMYGNRFNTTAYGGDALLINESVFRKSGLLSSVGGFIDINNTLLYFFDPVMHAGARRILGLEKEPTRSPRSPQPPKADTPSPPSG